ncbi:hypothetical protein AF52_01100 [Klebsiella pneumoniae MGH 66]|nr:hypothetical protein AF52_01100 [Klebsiella pneumoniae MGH 66]
MQPESYGATVDEGFIVGGPVGDFELLLCHGTVCVVGKIRDLILQLSKSSIYSTKPLGTLSLRISSREMIIKGSTRVKQGTQQSSKQQEKEKAKQRNDSSASGPSESRTAESPTPSVNQTTRTEGGAPTSVSNIGNVSEGLRLPPEAEQYRDYIIETAKKYEFQPEGLSALIYAESRWKANATNPTGSGAVGLGKVRISRSFLPKLTR